jgi:hypothetical protein
MRNTAFIDFSTTYFSVLLFTLEMTNVLIYVSFLQEWGKPGDIHNLGLTWHVPSDEEIGAAQKLLDEFLADELTTLNDFADGKVPLNRDQLLNRLNVVSNILYGCGSLLPFWKNGDKTEEEDFCPKNLVDSVTDLTPLEFVTVPRALKLTLRGKNVRQEIAATASKLQVNVTYLYYPYVTFYIPKQLNYQGYRL